MDFSKEFQKVEKAVVNIVALDVNNNNNPVSSGSGVLIGDGDIALTCNHCVIPGYKMAARPSGLSTQGQLARVLFQDKKTDIAILKFNQIIGVPASLKSSNSVSIGHEAFVVGFPNNIATKTALSANIAGIDPNGSILLDASVNHGNSGGPLFNSSGEVVGIVNAKHGSLSKYLDQVEALDDSFQMSVGGVNTFDVFKKLIHEMKKNLNLGIGYAIPITHIGSINPMVNALIQN